MQSPSTLNGAQAVVTTDSAASHSFINYHFTQKVGIACTPDHRVVELADGSHTVANKRCKVKIRMKPIHGGMYTKTITAYVVDLGKDHDMILGDDWLRKEQVDLSFGGRYMCLKAGGGEIKIPTLNPTDNTSWAKRNKPVSLPP